MNNNNNTDRRIWRSPHVARKASAPETVPDTVSEIVHDLRAPLGGIDAMARLLAETELSTAQRRLVDGLMAASDHLRRVADDVLDEAADARAVMVLRPHVCDLRALLVQIAVSAEARTASKGLAFRLICSPDVPQTVLLDAVRFRRMVENLIDNAVKMTPAGSVALEVSVEPSTASLRIVVRDTGPGLDSQMSAAVFEPFRHGADQGAGAGLGLFIVRKLARLMGGEAGVESTPGEGAAFWFIVELHTSLVVPAADDVRALTSADTALAQDILVVDDNAANRQIMQVMLGHFGWRCVMAETGEEALALLAQQRFAAVMLDQSLPGMKGLAVLKAIRNSGGALASTPVIAVTGHVGRKDRDAFQKAGASGFIAKPFAARDIQDALLVLDHG